MIRCLLWRLSFSGRLLQKKFGFYRRDKRVLYFAFGANLDPHVVARRGIDVWEAREHVLDGYSIEFTQSCEEVKGKGYASIAECPGQKVYGSLMLISRMDASLLDHYELATIIKKYRRQVLDHKGERFYFYQTIVREAGLRPDHSYLSKILRGCKLLSHVPDEYLQGLARTPVVSLRVCNNEPGFLFPKALYRAVPAPIVGALRRYDLFTVRLFFNYLYPKG